MDIKFTIPGNTEHFNGEPQPQKKDYKEYISECFYKQYKIQKTSVVIDDALADALINQKGYPLRPANGYAAPLDIKKFNVSIDVDIFWAENPGDAIMVYGVVANSLVGGNLKTLKSGGFTSQMSKDKCGRVDVTIGIQ